MNNLRRLPLLAPLMRKRQNPSRLVLNPTWMNRKLRINLAAFHVKYDDLQLDSVVPEPSSPVGQESRVTNAGKSNVSGFEIELTALPSTDLLFQATLGYLDAECDEYACLLGNPAAQPAGFDLVDPTFNLYDCTFLQPKRSPKWTIGASADYQWQVGLGMMGVNLSFSSSSKYFNDTLNSQAGLSESRTLLNSSIRLVDVDDRWKVSVFVLNLTDKEYQAAGLGVANLWGFSSYGPPRTWGIGARYEILAAQGGR